MGHAIRVWDTEHCTVQVTCELRCALNVTPYLDIDLQVCKNYLELFLYGEITSLFISSGGQNQNLIRTMLSETSGIQELCAIWDRWHHNGSRIATRRQNDFLFHYFSNELITRGKAIEALRSRSILVDRGITYGHVTLVEILPDEVIRRLTHIFSADILSSGRRIKVSQKFKSDEDEDS